jgi:hypothetical protein
MPLLQVGGSWDIVQDNGFRVALNVTQTGDRLDAFATHSAGRVVSTEATGSVTSSHFDMTITWNDGSKGHYTGDWKRGVFDSGSNGYLDGTSVDVNHPGSHADWFSENIVVRPA